MFLTVTEYINTLSNSVEGFIVAGLLVVLFIWLYIRTSLHIQSADKEQLERLQQSLMLYSRVTGPLGEMMEHNEHSLEEISQLIFLLEECKAAPLLTSDLHAQIDAYIRERDQSRLTILHNMWVREVNRRIEEQSNLLRKLDRPSWGFSFWLLLKPAIPFLAVLAILLWSLQLHQTLRELGNSNATTWDMINAWARFISCVIATASLYLVFMYTRRLPYHLVSTSLYISISAVALFHLLGVQMAVYIIAAQVILYLAGFSLTTKRKRGERPYAGKDLIIDMENLHKTTDLSQDISQLPTRRSKSSRNK